MQSKDIVTITQNTIRHLGYDDADIDVLHDADIDVVIVHITVADPRVLIGRNGEGLKALNHVIRQLCEQQKETADVVDNFLVDINEYSRKHIDMLKTRARIVAERVRSFKKDIPMEPMSSYDRLLMHSYLGSLPDITTESCGEGLERHIVVKYNGAS